MLRIDVEDPDVSKDFKSGFIGATAKHYPRDSDIIRISEYKNLLKDVLKIFPLNVQSTCEHQFQSYKMMLLSLWHLPERHQAMLDELYVLMQRLLMAITNMNAPESEFLEYEATTDDEFPVCFDEDDKLRTDHIWDQISKQIDLYSGQPRFKYLAEFPKFLLLISHSNAQWEYTQWIRKIFTDGHHNLGKEATQGHASTSVYKETTFIRNNLLGIIIPRKV